VRPVLLESHLKAVTSDNNNNNNNNNNKQAFFQKQSRKYCSSKPFRYEGPVPGTLCFAIIPLYDICSVNIRAEQIRLWVQSAWN
jgi:hypothetical protein